MKRKDAVKLRRGKSVVYISVNLSRPAVIPCAKALIDILNEYKVCILMNETSKEVFSDKNVSFVNYEKGFSEAEIIFVVGGDGTVLRAAKNALIYDKPILGINAGRLGFLSDIESDDLSSVRKLFTEGCRVEKRMVLNVKVGNDSVYAINDMFITLNEPGKIAEYFVNCEGREVCRYRADGIVLATPDGSTGYSMSAGGPVLDTALNAVIMTPVCPHSLISRSILFSSDKEIFVGSAFNGDEDKLDIIVDGEEKFRIKKGQNVSVKASEKSIKFVNISGRGFYEVLNQKIIGRR